MKIKFRYSDEYVSFAINKLFTLTLTKGGGYIIELSVCVTVVVVDVVDVVVVAVVVVVDALFQFEPFNLLFSFPAFFLFLLFRFQNKVLTDKKKKLIQDSPER